MRTSLFALLLLGATVNVMAEASQPVGQMDVRSRVDVALEGRPAYTRSEGTLVVPPGAQLLTSGADSALALANGDAVVMGEKTLVDVQGTADAPNVMVSRGQATIAREAGSNATYRAGEFTLVPATPGNPLTARLGVMDDASVMAHALEGDFSLVSRDGESYPVPQGRAVRLVLGEDGKVRTMLTQEETVPTDLPADAAANEIPEGNDETQDQTKVMEEQDDDGGWLWFLGGGGSALVVGGVATGVVVGGVAIANNNSGGGGGSDDTERGPGFRPPVSPIVPPNDNITPPPDMVDCVPLEAGSLIDPRNTTFCPPTNQVTGF